MGGRGSSSGAKGGGGSQSQSASNNQINNYLNSIGTGVKFDGEHVQIDTSKLPEITGTEKQVQWAESIRQNAYNAVASEYRQGIVGGRSVTSGEITTYPIDKIKNSDSIKVASSMKKDLDNVYSKVTKASDIIERRMYMGSDGVLTEMRKRKNKLKS